MFAFDRIVLHAAVVRRLNGNGFCVDNVIKVGW